MRFQHAAPQGRQILAARPPCTIMVAFDHLYLYVTAVGCWPAVAAAGLLPARPCPCYCAPCGSRRTQSHQPARRPAKCAALCAPPALKSDPTNTFRQRLLPGCVTAHCRKIGNWPIPRPGGWRMHPRARIMIPVLRRASNIIIVLGQGAQPDRVLIRRGHLFFRP